MESLAEQMKQSNQDKLKKFVSRRLKQMVFGAGLAIGLPITAFMASYSPNPYKDLPIVQELDNARKSEQMLIIEQKRLSQDANSISLPYQPDSIKPYINEINQLRDQSEQGKIARNLERTLSTIQTDIKRLENNEDIQKFSAHENKNYKSFKIFAYSYITSILLFGGICFYTACNDLKRNLMR